MGSHAKFILSLSIFFGVYELFRYLSLPYIQSGIGNIASFVIHYAVAYSLLFMLGLRIPSLVKSQIIKISIANLTLFILISFGLFITYGKFIPTQDLKYPPSIYYFSYAIFISSILWIYSVDIDNILIKIKLIGLVLFIAQNSLWIYLWHIPFIKMFVEVVETNFFLKYLITFSMSAFITYCQVWIVNNVITRHITNATFNKNIKALLTG
ncbi:hypothetical protein NIES2101_37345 [Calothrix sp. HK-06]|nr:hypothetical protein NIES2101_37345 [Calothrix sp. HK-06]